jgi:hypothetical protein
MYSNWRGELVVVTQTNFNLSSEFTKERARQVFADAGQKFLGMKGLVRKYFMLTEEDGGTASSIYLWEDRSYPEGFYTDEWYDFIEEKYGHRPTVSYFDCPVIVDNLTDQILVNE